MSTITTTIPHVSLPLPLPAMERDVTTKTVPRYLGAIDRREHADAFDHLVAICFRAVRPYFLTDRHEKVEVTETPQFGSIDGRRTGHTIRHEGAALDATREWIQEWLLTFLARYRGKSRHELVAAAEAGEFRYLGRLCKLRLLDELRNQTATKNQRPDDISLNDPVTEDGVSLLDCLGTARQDAPSSLARSLAFEEFLARVRNAFRAVAINTEKLKKLDLVDGFRALLATAEHLDHVSGRRYDDLVTRFIARLREVSPQSAREYKRKFRATVAREMSAGNPVVRCIFLELEPTSPEYNVCRELTERTSNQVTEPFLETHGCAWDEVEPEPDEK